MTAPAPRRTTSDARDVVIAASGLHAGYGDMVVVRDLCLDVAQGEVVALLGPNGSGKSTTLMTLAGVLPPLGGEVLWKGASTTAALHRRARQGLALVPEQKSVLSSLSVRDNLLLGRGDIAGALAIFPELEPLLPRPAGLLSGGEQQMLVLGRALAARPEALLIDELSLGLAPIVVDRLIAAVRAAADQARVAVLLVEQAARRALVVADRYYVMRHGAIVAAGSAEDADSTIAAAYFATPPDQPPTVDLEEKP